MSLNSPNFESHDMGTKYSLVQWKSLNVVVAIYDANERRLD